MSEQTQPKIYFGVVCFCYKRKRYYTVRAYFPDRFTDTDEFVSITQDEDLVFWQSPTLAIEQTRIDLQAKYPDHHIESYSVNREVVFNLTRIIQSLQHSTFNNFRRFHEVFHFAWEVDVYLEFTRHSDLFTDTYIEYIRKVLDIGLYPARLENHISLRAVYADLLVVARLIESQILTRGYVAR